MRSDVSGLFWNDYRPPKETTEKVKCVLPERTWESPDYLPFLAEARTMSVPMLTDTELIAAAGKDRFIFDIEVYENYFLAAFASLATGKYTFYEMGNGLVLDTARMQWLLENVCIAGFNSRDYDLPLCKLALAGKTTSQIKAASNKIIFENVNSQEILRAYKVKSFKVDHIDLIEVAPLRASLKVYGGRLHAPRMQDLPFRSDIALSQKQIQITRWYCVNDLVNTAALHDSLKEQLAIRERLGAEQGIDLRSKSDAQIAEAVVAAEIERMSGRRPQRPEIPVGTRYFYKTPAFLRYKSALMNWALNVVQQAEFVVQDHGSVDMPQALEELQLQIANTTYRMGIGGLHSCEQNMVHTTDDNCILADRDVVSYYPAIILNCQLFPQHLGTDFLEVYRRITDRRLAAKKAGDKAAAETLKITINGSFGKLGSKYSILYSPDLLIQTTITGQLSLLMLIEELELNGIAVVSANTDGAVIKCPRHLQDLMLRIVKLWEQQTGFETEETLYRAYYARDVNNYIAVKADGKTKAKGVFANPWAELYDAKQAVMRLHKNPANQICVEAVTEFLSKGTPVEQTIRTCNDVRKFVSVRAVKGGAVKDGVYLGRSIRWYYAVGQEGTIIYANTGAKVPRSDGAKPLMLLPNQLPSDIDYVWYEIEAKDMLRAFGFSNFGDDPSTMHHHEGDNDD